MWQKSLIDCDCNEHALEPIVKPCREEAEVGLRYCRCGEVPKNLGEASSRMVVLTWLSVRVTPLGNGSDDVHYLIREWNIVCRTRLG